METTIKLHAYNQFDSFEVGYKSSVFPMGEPYVKIDEVTDTVIGYGIVAHIGNSQGFLTLITLKDALDRMAGNPKVDLYLSYMPAGRQDRVMSHGESLSVKVYCSIINACNFHSVTVLDPHSDVTPACLGGIVKVEDNSYLYHESLNRILKYKEKDKFYLISPDSGANKKIKDLARHTYNDFLIDVVYCDKTRNISTGAITGFKVNYDDLQGQICVIVDDICDGGGTFIGLAKELKKKNAGPIYLVVSHGLFTKGLEPLKEDFAGVFTHPHFFKETDPFLHNIVHPLF